jgi:hypothetical protein
MYDIMCHHRAKMRPFTMDGRLRMFLMFLRVSNGCQMGVKLN